MVPDAAAARLRLGLVAGGPVVAVLPGSRADEVRYLGATFLAAIDALRKREPELQFVIPAADGALKAMLASMLASWPDLAREVRLVDGRSHDCLEAADAVLVASGTATLEAALYKRPMVIAYRMPAVSAWLMRRRQMIPWVGLPNILAGEFLVPELLQEQATPAALANALQAQLHDTELRTRLEQRFAVMHQELRRPTASLAAEAIIEVSDR
jgi:lipid-A-disaccharide synthase